MLDDRIGVWSCPENVVQIPEFKFFPEETDDLKHDEAVQRMSKNNSDQFLKNAVTSTFTTAEDLSY